MATCTPTWVANRGRKSFREISREDKAIDDIGFITESELKGKQIPLAILLFIVMAGALMLIGVVVYSVIVRGFAEP